MRRLQYLAAAGIVAIGVMAVPSAAWAQTDPDTPTEDVADEVTVDSHSDAGDTTAGAEETADEGGHADVEAVIHEAEENGATHADAECIEILAEGGTIDECREAPNPLLPEVNEIIWGGFGFLVVFVFVWKFGLPSIRQGMDARTERIRSAIDDADRQKAEAAQVLEDYQRQLADAKAESGRIIEEARQQADALKRDLQARAEADAAEARQRINDDIAAQVAAAQAGLQAQVAELSIQLAERVVERSLDRDTNLAMVENLIRDLESQNG